jgi:hypothetical protein
MKLINFNKLSMKHMKKDLLVRMLVDQASILMSMFIQEQVPTFVEKNLLLLNH